MNPKHSLTNVDDTKMVGDCAVCGPLVRIKKSNGKWYRCYAQYIYKKTEIERPWDFHRKDYCEKCGFIPEHTCQMTVDHIDGNKRNNNPENFQTLCANCHNLKSYLNKEHRNRYSAVQNA
jgi:5-methylcytosine-specific restriction endonuclease McrA